MFQQCGGGSDDVGERRHRSLAFRVYEHFGIGMFRLQCQEFLGGETLVDVASPVPKEHVAARDAVDVGSEVAVGTEDEWLVLGETLHNLSGIRRGDHHVGPCLGGSRGVDIRNHLVVRMLLHEFCKPVGRTAFGQRAGGVDVGTDDLLAGAEDAARFCHEVYAAHDDEVGLGLCRLLSQCQGVAHKVGNVLQGTVGVVVCQDDGIFLFCHPPYFGGHVGIFGNGLTDVTLFLPCTGNFHF